MSEVEHTDQASHADKSWVSHPWVQRWQGTLGFGVGVLSPRPGIAEAITHARYAEDLGLDSFWVQDHPRSGPDCWSTLTALAAATTRLRLGSFVSCIYYRSPTLLARLAADVDRLSGGRLVLGVGCGDAPGEFAGMDLPWPPVRERQAALEETIAIVNGLWNSKPFTYEGRYFRVREARLAAGPVQQPRIPLLIGGGGERVTLRQVAQYADMSNFGPTEQTGGAATPEGVPPKYAALRRHCETLGRPYDSVLRSYYAHVVLAETPDALTVKLQRYHPAGIPADQPRSLDEAIAIYRGMVQAGVQYLMAAVRGGDFETIRLFAGRVIPALQSA